MTGSHPIMNVSDPARAPTTPPDIGASTKVASDSKDPDLTRAATEREVVGSIVEQSIYRRGPLLGAGGRADESICSKTALTCCGSGRTVMMMSCP